MRITKPIIGILIACGIAASVSKAVPQHGKTITITNNTITVKIAPSIGRIIHFGFNNQRNILWLNNNPKAENQGWINWGGDKIWPAQQSNWNLIYGGGSWPPQTSLDGKPFQVTEQSDSKVVIESTCDTNLHIRLRRSISINPNKPELTIINTITRTAPSPWPVQIWSVSQCIPPRATMLAIAANAPDRKTRPFSNLWDAPLPSPNATIINDRALYFRLSKDLTIAKTGTIGSWCAALYDDLTFLQAFDAPADACYPDGANVEAFMFDSYTELELLSPSVHLQAGQSTTSTTTWYLLPAAGSPQKVLKQISASLP